MQEPDFEFVDNARTGLAKYSLERLKTIAPTFRERSAERLACVELIAEKERELALVQMGAVSRRAAAPPEVGAHAGESRTNRASHANAHPRTHRA